MCEYVRWVRCLKSCPTYAISSSVRSSTCKATNVGGSMRRMDVRRRMIAHTRGYFRVHSARLRKLLELRVARMPIPRFCLRIGVLLEIVLHSTYHYWTK
jgi:hypothetical protein